MAAALVLGLWFVVSGICFWTWVALFHHAPPGRMFLVWFEGLGSLIVLPLSKFVPLVPLKGEPPELLAADEFFKGPRR
jgi:hypothetical protein